MSKKQLPKRNVSFKLEKHPTAERLDRLRAQGVETIDDLDRLSDESSNSPLVTTADPFFTDPSVATSRSNINHNIDQLAVAIDKQIENSIDSDLIIATNKEVTNQVRTELLDPKLNILDPSATSLTLTSDPSPVVSFSNDLSNITSDATSNIMSSAISSHTSSATFSDIFNSTNSKNSTTSVATLAKKSLTNTDLFNEVQNTHSSSAQVVYKVITKLSSEKGKQTIRIGTKELLEKTKIKSHVTIRKAIDELIIKCSLEMIEANQGKIPPVYKIVPLVDIFSRREENLLVIDEDTKFLFQSGKRIWPIGNDKDSNMDITISHNMARHTKNTTSSTTSNIEANTTISSTSISTHILLNVKIKEVTRICEILDVKIIESPELIELEEYPLSHIIIGICKTVEESEVRNLTLLDCLEKIREHYKLMNALPESILAKVAYDYFLKVAKN